EDGIRDFHVTGVQTCALPIFASQMSVMRSSLLGSLLQVLKFNLDRKAARARIFEIGRIFLRDASVQDSVSTVAGFAQPMRVAGLDRKSTRLNSSHLKISYAVF